MEEGRGRWAGRCKHLTALEIYGSHTMYYMFSYKFLFLLKTLSF